MHKLQDKVVKIEKKEYTRMLVKRRKSQSVLELLIWNFGTCAFPKQFFKPNTEKNYDLWTLKQINKNSKSACSRKQMYFLWTKEYNSAKRIKKFASWFLWYLQRYRCKGWLSLCSRNYHYRQVRKESKRVGRRKSFLAGSYEFLALVQFLGLSHASIPHPFSLLFFINFFLYISSPVMRSVIFLSMNLKSLWGKEIWYYVYSKQKNFSFLIENSSEWGKLILD